MDTPRVTPDVAFVLGGGVRGAVEIGMLRALLERGIRPDLIVGTSIGAINGALVAQDPTPGVVDALMRAWVSPEASRVYGGSLAAQFGRILRTRVDQRALDAVAHDDARGGSARSGVSRIRGYGRCMPSDPAHQPATPFTHGGATMIWEARGEGSTTFVLLHGIGMGRTVFTGLAELLTPHGRVIAIDLPGYGEAPEPPRTPTVERLADVVAAFLRDANIPGPVLIGHSMGTQVAVEVSARHPDLGARLVLLGPTVEIGQRRARTQLRKLTRDLIDESPRVLLTGAREYVRAGPNLRQKVRAMLVHRPELAYPKVAGDTLVLRGEADTVAPRDWCRFVARSIPRARFAEVPGSGHETMIKNPDPAAELILDWLQSTPADPARA
jgi:pimeloyl-ACP methyl ester carboxylesterase